MNDFHDIFVVNYRSETSKYEAKLTLQMIWHLKLSYEFDVGQPWKLFRWVWDKMDHYFCLPKKAALKNCCVGLSTHFSQLVTYWPTYNHNLGKYTLVDKPWKKSIEYSIFIYLPSTFSVMVFCLLPNQNCSNYLFRNGRKWPIIVKKNLQNCIYFTIKKYSINS